MALTPGDGVRHSERLGPGRSVFDVIVLAGGRGSRLGRLSSDTPKPLTVVAGRPILHHLLEAVSHTAVEHVWIVTGYQGDRVASAVADFELDLPLDVTCVRQDYPESEGAIRSGLDRVRTPRVMVLCSDDLFPLSTLRHLAGSPSAGRFVTRVVRNSPTLRRVVVERGRIVGATTAVSAPIITYNFVLDSTVLRPWIELVVNARAPMVDALETFAQNGLYASADVNSASITYASDIPIVSRWIEEGQSR